MRVNAEAVFRKRGPNATTCKAMAEVKAGKVERFKDAESMFKALRSGSSARPSPRSSG